MANTPKPVRQKSKRISSAMRTEGKQSFPQKGVRKAKTRADVAFAKTRPGGKSLAKKVKKFGGGEYEKSLKAKLIKKKDKL